MAGGFYGADVEALRQLSKQFDQAAAELNRVTSTLTSHVNQAQAWQGPDAQQFRAAWNGSHTRTLDRAARALQLGSTGLAKNADEQNAASTDSARSGGGGASGAHGTVTLPGGGVVPFSITGKPGIGPDGLTPGTVAFGEHGRVEGNGALGGGSVTIRNGGSADANTVYGPNGAAEHTAKAGWGRGANEELHGNFRNGDLTGTGSVQQFLGAKGDTTAHAGVDSNGQYTAGAKADGMAGFEQNASGSLKVGQSSVGLDVKELAGAALNGNAGGTIGPEGMGVNAGGEAFAGLKGGVDGTLSVGGVTDKIGYEAYAGIGAHANFDGQATWNDVHLKIDAGVAFGLGGGFSQDISFSPEDAVASVAHSFGF
ncbi:WXG100 family type VII secretion target [Subtercola sp. RTI3]|uniref:WXG100 family type VII secretion target n=1 Tax=Subtercola sp. RTI3 TaxID=3048639 RepID=UPI002B226CA1|nr:WXG100 family type VII secretion target [Subtercola sp. RTI3]MEA9985422.1 WXG100 family type VII secretion target [Subtercola sp. RTI3]